MCAVKTLRSRLCTLYDSRNALDDLRTSPDTHVWFRKADRPAVFADIEGIYAKTPLSTESGITVSETQAQTIVADITQEKSAWDKWVEDGNIVVPNLFTWLWEGTAFEEGFESGIGSLIDDEFDMYQHHQRNINGKPNKGWLRTMMYSLTQQIIRQDISYWALYTALRPDRNPRLVAYPYYAKYAQSGDSTAFRHVDLNIPEYLESGRGGNAIQGSVSLDEETIEGGCTELIPGFHRRLKEWWADTTIGSEGRAIRGTTGRVHEINSLWSAAAATKYGQFVPVPCAQGAVRITRPEIFHGSLATQNKPGTYTRRRTILPWFVGLQEDRMTLDTAESDTWAELAIAHLTQSAPKSSPSGHPNMYGRIPYRFPAATQLFLDTPISNALMCRTLWDDPSVVAQAKVLLGVDRGAAQAEVARYRAKALMEFKRAYAHMVAAEIQYYRTESFFFQKEEPGS